MPACFPAGAADVTPPQIRHRRHLGKTVAKQLDLPIAEKDRPYFSPSEVRLVTSLTGLISDGLRRSLLLDDACADRHDTGMLVLDPDDGVDLASQVAEKWIDELGIGTRAGTTPPLVIRAVARQSAVGRKCKWAKRAPD